jgi:hypothetical protein
LNQKGKKARTRINNEEALIMKALVVTVVLVLVVEATPMLTANEPEIVEAAVP